MNPSKTPSTADASLANPPRLVRWLFAAGAQKGHSRGEVARYLGVTYGYLNQLDNGTRRTSTVSADFCRACARYLDVPAVVVMVASGRLTTPDFTKPQTEPERAQQLRSALERIADDPLLGCLMPPEAWDASDAVKTLLVALYEEATQQDLFAPRELPLLFQGLQEAARVVDELDAQELLALPVVGLTPSKVGALSSTGRRP
jgi:transcriptional regulator with XRE-family HTH domain